MYTSQVQVRDFKAALKGQKRVLLGSLSEECPCGTSAVELDASALRKALSALKSPNDAFCVLTFASYPGDMGERFVPAVYRIKSSRGGRAQNVLEKPAERWYTVLQVEYPCGAVARFPTCEIF